MHARSRVAIVLSCIALLALSVRVVWLLRHGPGEITWDGAEYARIAENLASGAGYIGVRGTTNFVFPPLYSLLIAALLPLTGDGARAGLAVSLISGAAFVWPVYLLAAAVFSQRTGYTAAVVAAVFPFAVQLSTVVLADMLFLTLVTTGLAFLVRTLAERRMADAAMCSAALALAYLTRPEGLLVELLAVAAIGGGVVMQRAGRGRFPALLLASILPFAVLAAPYVAFLTSHAGHLRVEGKSILNLDIGLRMDHGMTYAIAADAIDRNLDEVGPELRRDYDFEPAGRVAPSFVTIATFGAKNLLRHVPEIAHVALSRLCGTVAFALVAAIGLVAGPWTRKRAVGQVVLVAYALCVAVSLASVFHFWERYFVGFVPVFIVFAAFGTDVVVRAIGRRLPRVTPAVAMPIVALFFAACTFSTRTGYTDDAATIAELEAGKWLQSHAVDHRRILGISDQSVYYADGDWSMLPWAPDEETALRYARKIDPDYIVLNDEYAAERPYVRAWLAFGIPDRAARPVFSIKRAGTSVLTIVRWQPDAAERR